MLKLSARGLKQQDLRNVNPLLKIYSLNESVAIGQENFRGRTEELQNTTDPNWEETINITYHFERKQKLKFVIVNEAEDCDTPEIGH